MVSLNQTFVEQIRNSNLSDIEIKQILESARGVEDAGDLFELLIPGAGAGSIFAKKGLKVGAKVLKEAGEEVVERGVRTGEEFLEQRLRGRLRETATKEGVTIVSKEAGEEVIEKIIKESGEEAAEKTAAKWGVEVGHLRKAFNQLGVKGTIKLGRDLVGVGLVISGLQTLTMWASVDNIGQQASINIREISSQATFQDLDLNLAEEQIREQIKVLDGAERAIRAAAKFNPIIFAVGTRDIFIEAINGGRTAGDLALQNIALLMNKKAEDETLKQAELTRAEGTERRETDRLLEEGQKPGGEFDFEERGLTASEAIQGQIDARIRLQQEEESKRKPKRKETTRAAPKKTTTGGSNIIRQSRTPLGSREKKIKGRI